MNACVRTTAVALGAALALASPVLSPYAQAAATRTDVVAAAGTVPAQRPSGPPPVLRPAAFLTFETRPVRLTS